MIFLTVIENSDAMAYLFVGTVRVVVQIVQQLNYYNMYI